MIKFLKEKFLFLIDRKEKEFVRQRVMVGDHKILCVVLAVLSIIEAIMLILSFLGVDNSANKNIELSYQILYISLFAVCVLCLIFLNVFYKKKKPFPYFVLITIFTFTVMSWGVGISLLSSYESFSFLYYAIALIACSAFIVLEPWVETLCVLLPSIAYICLYYTLDGIKRVSDSIFLGGIILTIAIVLAAFYFNFYRRIHSIRLELQVSNLNEILKEKAYFDDLTKIRNRRYLTEHINDELVFGEECSGVMMLDLDHFKEINDTYGHRVGDICLEEMGKIINNFITGENGYAVRYGGEEFLILVKETDEKSFLAFAEKIRKKVEKNVISVDKNKVNYTVSIGVSLAHYEISYESLIYEADDALYTAKMTRNKVVLHGAK